MKDGRQYIVPMRVGSRIFAPRPFTTVLTLVVLAGLVWLGRWQLERADEKRTLYDAFAQGTAATRRIDLRTPAVPRYQHVSAQGRYDESRQILVDNMTNADGRAGYFVVTPFALSTGGWILVNRGWVPLGRSRAELPAVGVAGDVRTITGRADHLPSPGIQMGHPAALSPPFPAVANFPTRAQIGALLHETSWSRAADVVLLDRDQPDGYVRQWQAPGLPPLRHLAYAVQWFGLALALCVIYLVTNLRRADRTAGVP
jgi:surfeit locus 1 family protein